MLRCQYRVCFSIGALCAAADVGEYGAGGDPLYRLRGG